jgi:hypothetical protein
VERAFQAFADWYAAYGYPVLFLGVLPENAGIPVPGETAVLVAGFLASPAGGARFHLGAVIALTFAAAVLGDNLGFSLGRRWARPRRWESISPSWPAKARCSRRYSPLQPFDQRVCVPVQPGFAPAAERPQAVSPGLTAALRCGQGNSTGATPLARRHRQAFHRPRHRMRAPAGKCGVPPPSAVRWGQSSWRAVCRCPARERCAIPATGAHPRRGPHRTGRQSSLHRPAVSSPPAGTRRSWVPPLLAGRTGRQRPARPARRPPVRSCPTHQPPVRGTHRAALPP